MLNLTLYGIYPYNYLEEWFDYHKNIDPNMQWHEDDIIPGVTAFGLSYIAITGLTTYTFILAGYKDKGDDKGSQYKLVYNE